MRFGIGWRAELGAGILANLDRIDAIEVLAEELFEADRNTRRALRFLREHVPVLLHATSLGLASTERVDPRRLEQIARVIDWLEPELWSEHLAFVRAGRVEVGHLAAPPRNDATLAGLVRNVEEAQRVTGSRPVLENVASLIDPPCSTYDECSWLHAVLEATRCELLLDLHNVHTNATNFGFDAFEFVRSLPAPRLIHIAGGQVIERGRVLDDHKHAVPNVVYELLACVGAANATVILERDGNYPAIEELLAELDEARAVRRPHPPRPLWSAGLSARRGRAESPSLQKDDDAVIPLLANLYTNNDALKAYLQTNPLAIDEDDLLLAARSFARKRACK